MSTPRVGDVVRRLSDGHRFRILMLFPTIGESKCKDLTRSRVVRPRYADLCDGEQYAIEPTESSPERTE